MRPLQMAGRALAGLAWENGTFFEFSLCLSRACLGKIMHFIYKWRKKCRFLTNNRNVCLRGEGRRGSNPARVLAVAQIALPRRGAG